LAESDRFLVTSDFMREALGPLVAPQKPICVVAPGCRARPAPSAPPATGELRALLIGNLLPGKGIEPLLSSLAEQLQPADKLRLTILGSLDSDPDYAERCRRLIADQPALAGRVVLQGERSPEQVLRELAQAEVLLSASTMESYGMALAEARAAGVPILARAGGNVAQHVAASAGGELVFSTRELATACLELARAPERLRERLRAARKHAPPARTWSDAASELLTQLESPEK
jgi:glycosyltransferase involved in cell wall biosynthesis